MIGKVNGMIIDPRKRSPKPDFGLSRANTMQAAISFQRQYRRDRIAARFFPSEGLCLVGGTVKLVLAEQSAA